MKKEISLRAVKHHVGLNAMKIPGWITLVLIGISFAGIGIPYRYGQLTVSQATSAAAMCGFLIIALVFFLLMQYLFCGESKELQRKYAIGRKYYYHNTVANFKHVLVSLMNAFDSCWKTEYATAMKSTTSCNDEKSLAAWKERLDVSLSNRLALIEKAFNDSLIILSDREGIARLQECRAEGSTYLRDECEVLASVVRKCCLGLLTTEKCKAEIGLLHESHKRYLDELLHKYQQYADAYEDDERAWQVLHSTLFRK